MADYYRKRTGYFQLPRFHLKAIGTNADSFIRGPLENWIRGALLLDGKSQYLTIPNSQLTQEFTYKVTERVNRKKVTKTKTARGAAFKSPQIYDSSLLIELYFKLNAPNRQGILVQKCTPVAGNGPIRGYRLACDQEGRVVFTIGSTQGVFSVQTTTPLSPERWYHLIAEFDRPAGKLTLYLNGKAAGVKEQVKAASLANDGDLFVGGSPQGNHLPVALDFLRIARASLAESRTSIDELYAWEFNGPFYRDFTGQAPRGERDAGALELH